MKSVYKQRLLRFLKKMSEKYHVDLVYLFGGGFWLTLTQGFTYVGSFVLAVVFANFVDPTVYGNYTYVLSMFGLFSIFSLPGVDTAITQSVAKGFENSYFTGFYTKMRWSLLGSAGLIGLGLYYFFYTDKGVLGVPLFLGAVILPLMYGSQIFTAFFAGRRNFFEQTKARVGVQMFSYLMTVLTLLITHNLVALVLAYLIANAFGNYFFYHRTQRLFKPNQKDDKTAMGFGKHLSILQALSTGTSYIDQLLIFNFLGPVELAIYNFAISPVRQGTTAFQNLGHLLLPKFSEKSMQDIDRRFISRLLQLVGFGVIVAGVYMLIAPVIFKVFFPKYMTSLGYSQLFALTLIFQPVGPYLGSIFRSQKLTKSIYISGLTTQGMMLGLIFVLGYFFQITGIIWARVVAMLWSLGLAVVLWRMEMRKVS